MLLYFLDQHAFPPEPPGMWVAGDGRAEIIVRCEDVDRSSDGHRVLTHSDRVLDVDGRGNSHASTRAAAAGHLRRTGPGVRGLNSYAYLMTALSSDGFTPRLQDPNSKDSRNLAVLVNFRAVRSAESGRADEP